MEIENFKRNIGKWTDQRLSDAYLIYNSRVEEPKYAINKEILSNQRGIKKSWTPLSGCAGSG